jgi:hypothetical protein
MRVANIYRGRPDEPSVWTETVSGVSAASERMEQIAADEPGAYFIFNGQDQRILAQTDTS